VWCGGWSWLWLRGPVGEEFWTLTQLYVQERWYEQGVNVCGELGGLGGREKQVFGR